MAFVFVQAQTEATTSKVPGRTVFYAEYGGPGIYFQKILFTVEAVYYERRLIYTANCRC